MPQALRSVLAVLAGFVTMVAAVIVLTLVSVSILHLKSGHPTPLYLVLNVIYSLAAALLGGWVAARVAPANPRAHGVALAGVMLLFGLFQLRHPAPGQAFSYLLFLVIAPPFAAIAGSALTRSRRTA